MKCSKCGSESHFRAACPWKQGQGSAHAAFSPFVGKGLLAADLVFMTTSPGAQGSAAPGAPQDGLRARSSGDAAPDARPRHAAGRQPPDVAAESSSQSASTS